MMTLFLRVLFVECRERNGLDTVQNLDDVVFYVLCSSNLSLKQLLCCFFFVAFGPICPRVSVRGGVGMTIERGAVGA